MTTSDLLFKDLIRDLRREKNKIDKKITIIQKWINGEKTVKQSIQYKRKHSIRMKQVWAKKRAEQEKLLTKGKK